MGQRIQANYDALKLICKAFEQAADHTAAATYRVYQCTQELEAGAWTGLGAQTFFAEMRESVFPALEKLEAAFQFSADGVKQIAQIFQTAEEEAAALFKAFQRFLDSLDGGGGNGKEHAKEAPEDEGTPEPPPPATEEQINRLRELGIELGAGETITATEAAWLINYIGEDDGLLRGNPWTAADLREAITTLRKLDLLNFNIEQSTFIEGGWSLEELRQIDGVVDQMAENARSEFLERYTEDDLIRLAAYYQLPADKAGYAPLLLALEDRDVNLRRDGNDNTNYIMSGNDVQYYPAGTIDPTGRDVGGEPVVWYSYADASGDRHTYDIRQPLPEGATEWRESYWYGRADYPNGNLTFGDRAFFDNPQNNRSVGGTFTSDSLLAHEISHLIVGRTPGLATDFTNASGTGEGGINLSTTDTTGYSYNPRSSNNGDEPVTDLITNGLLGGFPDSAAGRVRAGQFDDIIGTVFEDNYPDGAENFRVTDSYDAAVREALGFQPNPGR